MIAGADEVSPHLDLIKGLGGALVRTGDDKFKATGLTKADVLEGRGRIRRRGCHPAGFVSVPRACSCCSSSRPSAWAAAFLTT